MKAIVLAAGMGTRLLPLTTHRPKHLLEIGGQSILYRTISQLLQHSTIDEIIIVINYKADQIQEAIRQWFPDQKVISFVQQEEANGTGDAVDTALQQAKVETSFLVINGDVLFVEPLANFIATAGDNSLVVGTTVDNPTAFGVFEHEDGFLTGIVEKPPSATPDSLVNAGFYIFTQEAIPLFQQLEYSSRGEREMTDVIDQLIQQDHQIKVHATSDGWFDVGKPWQVLDANERFMDLESESYEILAELEPNVHIHGKVHIAETARIRSGVYIEGPAYIDEGADIGPNCYIRGRTYLGRNTRVGNGCEVKNSLIYADSHAAHLSYIGDSILGQSCNLGAGTITANLRHDGKDIKLTVKDKRISSGRRKLGVVMGDHVKTGIGVDILPGVKISADSWLNAGEVITRDL